jgi:transcriptional regulator with GAF, ATPase, and Fis domain
VPAELLESELFGHKKGSFTGAIADRPGHFVAADGGTVFLDEIGDMPLAMQAKLLRVLQEGEVRPVGSNKVSKVDVRVIAATNKDLRAMCGEGSFREDLYFRLNVVTIQLPPLRERRGDVRHLVRFFSRRVGEEMGREVSFTNEALDALEGWRWPGNVRELENEIRRAAALSNGTVGVEGLSPAIQAAYEAS